MPIGYTLKYIAYNVLPCFLGLLQLIILIQTLLLLSRLFTAGILWYGVERNMGKKEKKRQKNQTAKYVHKSIICI